MPRSRHAVAALLLLPWIGTATSSAAEATGTPAAVAPNQRTDVVETTAGLLEIRPLFHGSVMLTFNAKVIYIDPFGRADFSGLPLADLIVITHTHLGHLDRPLVEKLHQPATTIVGPPAVIDTLNCAPACGNPEEIADTARKTVMGTVATGVLGMFARLHRHDVDGRWEDGRLASGHRPTTTRC